MAMFRFSKMVVAAIFDFRNFKILMVRRVTAVKLRQFTYFVVIGQTVTEMWKFFDFSKMAAVRHVGFVMCVFGLSTKGIWWSLSLCNIWLESIW